MALTYQKLLKIFGSKSSFVKNDIEHSKSELDYFLMSIPCFIYFILHQGLIAFLLTSISDTSNLNKEKYNNERFLLFSEFYYLFNIQPEFSLSMSIANAFVSLIVMLMLYLVLKQRYNVPEFKTYTIRLNFMLVYGIYACIFQLYFIYQCLNKSAIEKSNELDTKFLLYTVIIFMIHVILNITYAIIVLFNVVIIRKNQVLSQKEEQWLNLKVVIIVFLILAFTIYLVSVFNLYDYLLSFNLSIIENNKIYIYRFFPFYINSLIGILHLSYYFEMRYVILSFSQNMEVNNLFNHDYLN